MFGTLDFWLGRGVFTGWYAVFYAGILAGYLPYAPQAWERVGRGGSGPESLGVFAVLLLFWGGPLVLFSGIHAVAFLVGGGDPFWVRLLWTLGLVAAAIVAVVAASLLAANSRGAGILACHAILAALVVANLTALWVARHAAPVRAVLS